MMSSGRENPTFVDFVAARAASLERASWLLTGDRQLAEDLLQSTFCKVWPRWDRIQRTDQDPEAYVRRVLYTTYVSWWRRRSSHEASTPSFVDQERKSAQEFMDQSIDRTMLMAALAKLPPRQRAALVLRYFEDCTIQEASMLMEISTGSFSKHLARALTTLRQDALIDPGVEKVDQE